MSLWLSRVALILLGSLAGLISQLTWMGSHGWGEAAVRIPLGLLGGGLVFWLLSELLVFPLRRAGKDFGGAVARGAWRMLTYGPMWRLLAIFWITLVTGLGLGVYIYVARVWPYPLIHEVVAWVEGAGATSLKEKVVNDLNIAPTRHLVTVPNAQAAGRAYRELSGLHLDERRLPPKVFLAPDAPQALRVIFGAFDFTDHRYGAILLGPKGKVRHIWLTTQEDVPWEHAPDSNVFPHGFAVDRDGSIYVLFDEGSCLIKYDYCGRAVWRTQGAFHHSISLGSDGTLWALGPTRENRKRKDCLVQLDQATGRILKSIPFSKLLEANPEIDIFSIRQMDESDHSAWVTGGGGQWHLNDIEPLTKELAPLYFGFKPGDLLVSLRSVDLVFVMDPNTLKVKWWRQGLTRRQHDPDWNQRGTITILNNNMHRGNSSIVEINPRTYKSQVLVDGKKYRFYTPIQGKHQILPEGGVLITSPQQGRVFEVDAKGKVVFEFLNLYDNQNRLLCVSQAVLLPTDYFRELPKCP